MGRLSNYELADRYKEKSELLGGVGVQFEYIGKDRIKLVGVRGDMEGRLEIPRFITDINVCGPSIFLRLGPLYKARYNEIVIDGEYIQDIRNLCSGLYSEHVKLVIKNADKIRNMHGLFENSNNLRSIELEGTDTRNVEDIAHMFSGCTKLEHIDISKLDTRNVRDMRGMFMNCHNLRDVVGIGRLDMHKVEDMSCMFYNCRSIKRVDISGIDISRVKDRSYMFNRCMELEYVSNNLLEDDDSIDTSYMFDDCINLLRWGEE